MSAPLLAVENLYAGYEAGVPIVRGASITVASGEIVAVLGPNGAGKSTLIRAIAGLVPKFGGRVSLAGRDITHAKAHELVRNGLGFVPQTENVFTRLSIDDNLKLASDVLPRPERAVQIEATYALFPDLTRRRTLLAGWLSGGQRQMLTIARALIPKPSILILDEATAGLSPKLVTLVLDKLAEIRRGGTTILIVEQNARAALAFADRAYILADGKNAQEGRAADLAQDPAIGRLYLGQKVERDGDRPNL
jgi:branched-chain amino acid transport system ATP-binding protein